MYLKVDRMRRSIWAPLRLQSTAGRQPRLWVILLYRWLSFQCLVRLACPGSSGRPSSLVCLFSCRQHAWQSAEYSACSDCFVAE